MLMPESLAPHQQFYKENAWQDYTFAELGWWVHLFCTRAMHRTDLTKRNKDLYDAQNYLNMTQAKLDALKGSTFV